MRAPDEWSQMDGANLSVTAESQCQMTVAPQPQFSCNHNYAGEIVTVTIRLAISVC
jgi:hypothetical protein